MLRIENDNEPLFDYLGRYPSPPDAQWIENWSDLLHDLTPEEIDTAAALWAGRL